MWTILSCFYLHVHMLRVGYVNFEPPDVKNIQLPIILMSKNQNENRQVPIPLK